GDPAALAAEVTDTLLLFLLARSGRIPLHAAGVMSGDTALVLSGPSGSGKSTLALAAAARGFQVLSDDTVFIEVGPPARVWGLPRPIHVFPADAPSGAGATRQRGGKLKSVVPLDAALSRRVADQAKLILLNRSDRLALTPLDTEAAVAGLSRLEPGFHLLREESEAAARALARHGAWRLDLADDPAAAIEFISTRLSSAAPQ
ncbi:MAG: hypothetical protein ACM3YM_01415, partial [Sphingomonadales bacterium]